MTKSTNNVLRLPNTVHVSLFDRMLLRKISSHMCTYYLLLITNWIAHDIDLSDTPPEADIVIAAPERVIKAPEYAEMNWDILY